jgi:DNA-binding XRE family transcriptional regulator
MPKTRPQATQFSNFAIDYTPLRRVRRAKFEMTMADLARAVGVHPHTIYRLEKNRVEPTHRLVIALSRALGVPHTDLYTLASPDERA